MGFEEHKVEGFKEYSDLFTKLSTETKNRIVTLFCASLDATGRSWCGDCRNGKNISQKYSDTYSFGLP